MSGTLEIEDLEVNLGGRRVIHDTSLKIGPGQLVGLIGPNGAGKTTLLRTALGLLEADRGEVRVEGRHVRAGRARIGYVPQRHEFAWEFPTSVENAVMSGRTGRLGLFRRPGIEDWTAVDRAIERVAMVDLKDRPIGQLSGGQRQRVLVARALATEPVLLLLDEPLSGLDMPSQEMLVELFADLAHDGGSLLMTTHDLAAALYSCDRIVLFNRTVIVEGSPATLAGNSAAWQETFEVGAESPFLRVLKAAA
jgi:manganese/iron transport system ATP-binding protein